MGDATEAADLAGRLTDEARIARARLADIEAGVYGQRHPADPDLLEAAAEEIARLRADRAALLATCREALAAIPERSYARPLILGAIAGAAGESPP